MKTIWVGSDYHLGHRMLVDKGHRPEGYEQRLIDNALSVARPDDWFINLGDFVLGKAGEEMGKQFLHDLRCRIGKGGRMILVRGNHDNKTAARYCRDEWDFCCDEFQLDIYGLKIGFAHRPRVAHHYDRLVHGHLHGSNTRYGDWDKVDKLIQVSMELLDYRPIPLRTLAVSGCTMAFRNGKFEWR